MNHLSEEQLVDAYYDRSGKMRAHLNECPECRAAYERLEEQLDGMRDYGAPARGSSYGSEVWTRLLPHLPPAPKQRAGWRWWRVAPVLATLLVVAFVAGMLTQRRTQEAGNSERARERLLLMAMSRHLERSQIMLSEIANGNPRSIDLPEERERARDLLNDNRLLRQTAARSGDAVDASLLEELERVLLDVANSPADITPRDFEALQSRIDNEGLLFKVRITSSDVRFRGQKL